MSFYTYIIQSERDQSYYIGSSKDPEGRLLKNNQKHQGYTARKQPWKLVWKEMHTQKSEAIKKEMFLKKQKSKKPAWIDVKKSLKDFESSQLIELLKELYQLSDENKNFLHARFNGSTASLQNYKIIILDCLYEDPLDDNVNFDFDKAEKTIKAYTLSCLNTCLFI